MIWMDFYVLIHGKYLTFCIVQRIFLLIKLLTLDVNFVRQHEYTGVQVDESSTDDNKIPMKVKVKKSG